MALCLPLLALAPAAFGAQSTATDQAQAETTAPALRYQSAFADYKPWQDIKPGNWRELNDKLAATQGQATGHSGHGAAAVPATPASAPEKSSVPATPAHQGHHPQGGKP